VHASHILIKPEAGPDPNKAKADAKTKAEDLLKQVRDGGDFAALAKQHSACPSAPKGGDLGSQPRGAWVKPFEDAAFATRAGEVSDVVETQFGYHIIKVSEHKQAGMMPFEQVKDRLMNGLKGQKQKEFFQQYTEGLKKDARIEYPVGKEPKPKADVMPPGAMQVKPGTAPKPKPQ